jgi:MFS family permease
LLPSVLFVTLLTLGQMLLVPSAKDLIPRFAEESTLGAHYGALATAGGIAVLAGNLLFGSLLDRALVPSTQAIYPWLLLALFPLCSALALQVICRPLEAERLTFSRYFSGHIPAPDDTRSIRSANGQDRMTP